MIYRVGSVEIDPANFLLTEDGKSIPVEPLVFDLIVYLIEHRDRVLTRQELLDRIWAGRIVSDTSLSNHIKSARHALGDDGQRQEVIKTIHGRGYRFVADATEVPGQDSSGRDVPTGDRPADQPPHGLGRKRLMAYAAIFLLLVAAGSRVVFFPPDEAIESIAVLPLKNLSNDPSQEYFVEGMQDALITQLSRLTELRVISKTSTSRYEEPNRSIPEIARELNVDAVIEGSVLRDGDRVRITAQLIRGSEDEHLWAQSYDRDLGHALTLINDISLAIADEVEATVSRQHVDEPSQRRPVDLKVHELVLQGHHYFDRFMFDQSLKHYQQAVDLDPEFAPAHVGVAGSNILMAFFGWGPSSEFVPKAREAALAALSLDSNASGGYATLGAIQLYFDWDWALAEKNLLRALELQPNDARTRHAYADYLMVTGDLEESLKQVKIGLLYDPLSPMASNVVDFHSILARRYDDVIERGRQAVAASPESLANLSHYHEALWLNGMHEEAFDAYKKSWGRDERLMLAMETGFSESGYTGAIRHLADALAARGADTPGDVTLASLYARAGAPNMALEWLEKAYQYRQPQLLHVKAMPVFEELRAYPGFQDLLRRVGFPETLEGID